MGDRVPSDEEVAEQFWLNRARDSERELKQARAHVERLERVVRAWTDAGPRPNWHEVMKARLRSEWPMLYDALVALVEDAAAERWKRASAKPRDRWDEEWDDQGNPR